MNKIGSENKMKTANIDWHEDLGRYQGHEIAGKSDRWQNTY